MNYLKKYRVLLLLLCAAISSQAQTYPDLSGTWYPNNNSSQPCYIIQNAHYLTFVIGGSTSSSTGNFTSGKQIFATTWNAYATYSSDLNTITWTDQTWNRAYLSYPHIAGTWTVNGNAVTITQNGKHLEFTMGSGRSKGYFYATNYIYANEWNTYATYDPATKSLKWSDQTWTFTSAANNDNERNEKDALYYNSKGIEFYNNKEYDLAITNYTKAISLSPGEKTYYLNRGLAYHSKLQYDFAIQDYTKAISLSSVYYEAYSSRGTAYYYKALYDLSIQDYTKAISLKPSEALAHFNLGLPHYAKGEYDQAINTYSKAISLGLNESYVYHNRSLAYYTKGQYNASIQDNTKAISLDAKNTNAYNCRGLCYNNLGNYEMAVSDFVKAISLDDKFTYSYINILEPLARLQQFSKAAYYYNSYRSKGLTTYIDNNADWAFFKKYAEAIVNGINVNNYSAALSLLEEAEKLYNSRQNKNDNAQKRNFASILVLKGYVLEQLNRNQEATDTYNQALVLSATQPDVVEALARLQKKQVVLVKADNTAPVIELISPQPSRSFDIVDDEEKIQVLGRAKDESGISAVTINGVKAEKIEEDGFFMASVSMQGGKNELRIQAIDKKGNKAENTFSINSRVVVKDKPKTVDIPEVGSNTPVYHAILIASQHYSDERIPDLQNPINDAREVRKLITTKYRFETQNVDTIFDKSREEILEAIIAKCARLENNDNLLIFYAGHGTAVKDQFNDVDGYWLPSSARKGNISTYISSDDLNKSFKRSKAHHILVIADACFSGSFLRALPSDAEVSIQNQYNLKCRKAMASGNMEPVPDNSKFIYYFRQRLTENKEKYLTAESLFDSFKVAVRNNTGNLPQYGAISNVGDEGGEFVFIKR